MVVTTSSVSTVSRRHYNKILMLDKSRLKGLQHLLPYTHKPTFTDLLAKKEDYFQTFYLVTPKTEWMWCNMNTAISVKVPSHWC